jgi:hypothetical protein
MCGAVQLEITGEPAVQAFCHCSSCRGWLSAPIHAAALWPATSVKVTKGADNLGLYKKTENSHRKFCKSCGAAVLVDHPGMGMVDVPAGSVAAQPQACGTCGESHGRESGLPNSRTFRRSSALGRNARRVAPTTTVSPRRHRPRVCSRLCNSGSTGLALPTHISISLEL